MNIQYWSVRITSLNGQLLGVEIQPQIEIHGCQVIAGDVLKRQLHHEQMSVIRRKEEWFRSNGLFCAVSTPILPTESADYIKYFGLHWLDDVGRRGTTAVELLNGDYEVVRLNRRFSDELIGSVMFPVLLQNIHRCCDKVIVQVQNTNHHQLLKGCGVWAVQGMYKPIRFEHCEKLL
ncbi:TPA: hypothetical protein J7727_004584 [Escherichia coli]|nr:hypothetical protein [Escherichia coli]